MITFKQFLTEQQCTLPAYVSKVVEKAAKHCIYQRMSTNQGLQCSELKQVSSTFFATSKKHPGYCFPYFSNDMFAVVIVYGHDVIVLQRVLNVTSKDGLVKMEVIGTNNTKYKDAKSCTNLLNDPKAKVYWQTFNSVKHYNASRRKYDDDFDHKKEIDHNEIYTSPALFV